MFNFGIVDCKRNDLFTAADGVVEYYFTFAQESEQPFHWIMTYVVEKTHEHWHCMLLSTEEQWHTAY